MTSLEQQPLRNLRPVCAAQRRRHISGPKKLRFASAVVFTAICSASSLNAADPQLPQIHLNTTYTPPTGGATRSVDAGADLQAAIDAAEPGDIIELEAGATFMGNYVLRPTPGGGWIYVTSSKLAQLPKEGTRVSPRDAVNMPKIICPNQFKPALIIEPGVRQYRFVGVEITTAYTERTGVQYGVVRVGWRANGTASDQPAEDIIFDRCYVHGTASGNIRDGIVSYNVKKWAIIDCHVSEFHGVGYESHAIHVYSSPGPTRIANNYIQGAGINVFIGDSRLPAEAMPQDIEIVGNHLHKPWSWKPDRAEYAGTRWLVKNILEIKAAQRVLIDGNIMENVWVGGQHGQVMVLTPRAAQIEDVTIRRNVCRNFQGALNINSADVRLERVLVENNLFYGMNADDSFFITMAGTPGRLNDVSIRHNTMLAEANNGWIVFNGSRPAEINRLELRDNVVSHGRYGIIGNGKGVGLPSVEWYCTNFDIRRNVMIGGQPSYHTTSVHYREHLFPADASDIGFADPRLQEIRHFRLGADSRPKWGGTDGKVLGADIDEILETTKE